MFKSSIFKLASLSILAWIIPLFVSFFMTDNSKSVISYKPDFLTFKVTMFVLLLVITLISYIYLRKTTKLNWLVVAMFFLLTSCVLDVLVLINVFRMNTTSWVLTVLPVYLLIFFGLALIILRKETSGEIKTMAGNKVNEVKKSATDKVNDIIN